MNLPSIIWPQMNVCQTNDSKQIFWMHNIFLCPCDLKSTLEDAPVYHVGYLSSDGFLRTCAKSVLASFLLPFGRMNSKSIEGIQQLPVYQVWSLSRRVCKLLSGQFVLCHFFYLSIFYLLIWKSTLDSSTIFIHRKWMGLGSRLKPI
jgi:hypothetical protein